MGLLHILKKIKRKEKEMRILMLGLDNAGKTTTVKQFSGEARYGLPKVSATTLSIDYFVQISPTLGFQISTLEYRGYSLNIWDVGGQNTIRSYWRNYFEQTDGLIWVVDSADIRRLKECRTHLHETLKEERLAGASLLILANKQDLDGALSEREISAVLQLGKILTHHVKVVAICATSGQGLKDGVDWLVEDIASRIYRLELFQYNVNN